MKKILLLLAVFFLIYIYFNNTKDYYVIPNDAIRFRIIANSNSIYDQYVKNKVKTNLEKEFLADLSDSNSIEDSRKIIINNLDNYKDIIKLTLNEEDKINYKVNYGLNYFPQKEYKGTYYEAGNYESLVITLGKGEGDNFWCVLFPPMCSLEVEEKTDNIEYRFLVKDLFDKYILKKQNIT